MCSRLRTISISLSFLTTNLPHTIAHQSIRENLDHLVGNDHIMEAGRLLIRKEDIRQPEAIDVAERHCDRRILVGEF